MARLWSTGFELQSVTGGVEFDTATAPAISTTTVHGGAASLEISGSIGAAGYKGISHQFSTGSATVYGRAYFYAAAMPNDANTVTTIDLTSGATNVVSIQFWGDGTANLVGIAYYNNFAGATGTFAASVGAWHSVEWFYDTSPADGAEVLTVRIDGVQVVTTAALTYTVKTINSVQVGVYNGAAGATTGATVYYDDLAINDTTGSQENSWPGEGYIVHAYPSAAGSSNTWQTAAGGVGSATNYQAVDEVTPDNATTYLKRIATTIRVDDYLTPTASTLGIGSGDTIKLVAVGVRGGSTVNTAATGRDILMRVKSAAAGTVSKSGTSQNRMHGATGTFFTHSAVVPRTYKLTSYTDPTTGVAWTPTGTNSIDNMQIGMENQTSVTTEVRVSTVWALIEYVPSSGSSANITVPVASLALTSFAPTASATTGGPGSATPDTATLTLTTLAPTITVGVTTPKAQTLVEDFTAGTLPASLTDGTGGNLTFTGGQAIIGGATTSTYRPMKTGAVYDLTSSYFFAEITPGDMTQVSRQTFLFAEIDANNKVFWLLNNGTVQAMQQVATVETSVQSVAYNAAVHKWFRLREASGTTYWDYSTDGVSWTNFASVANPITLTALYLGVMLGNWQAEAATTTAVFDNFNVTPVVGTVITPPVATLTTTGLAPTVATTTHQTITVPVRSVTTARFAPTVNASNHQVVIVPTATRTLTTFVPVVRRSVIPPTTALTLTRFAPDVAFTGHVTITPPTTALVLTTHIPGVGMPTSIVPGTRALTLTTFAPQLKLSVIPPTTALTATRFVPTVAISNHITITVPVRALVDTQFAPTVTASNHKLYEVPTRALTLSTFAPVISVLADGPFDWKGYTWIRRSAAIAGAPHFNGQWSAYNVILNADDTVTLRLTNPTGTAPIAAEFYSARQGWGYGTYQIVVGSRLDTLDKVVVFGGAFTYDPLVLPHANEIDIHETSAWGNNVTVKTSHNVYYDSGDHVNELIAHTEYETTADPVTTHLMIWAPDKVTFRSYQGEGTGGTLLKETIHTEHVPTPAAERMHFNLWVADYGTGLPGAPAQPTDVIVKSFSYRENYLESNFVPLRANLTSGGRTTVSGGGNSSDTVTASPKVARINGPATIKDISSKTNKNSLDNPTNKTETK